MKARLSFLIGAALGSGFLGIGPFGEAETTAEESPIFRDSTNDTGLSFTHYNGATGELHFPEVFGSGAALFDADGDGDLDLYLVQGAALGDPAREPLFKRQGPTGDRLFRNDLVRGKVSFVDITEAAGILAEGYGMGVATGDYDADGDVDFYVTNFGANQLWQNRGDGSFVEVGSRAGVAGSQWSVAAVFFDYDGDGALDLFVANYTSFRTAINHPCRAAGGYRDYCSPTSYDPEADRLYRNLGNGTFADVTANVGLNADPGNGLGTTVGDFNGDGWIDLYVANDEMPNALWMNHNGVRFQNMALVLGAAVSGSGEPQASMGIDTADLDDDADLDLFMTHFAHESNTLYINEAGAFEDRSTASGLGTPSWPMTGFGTAFLDYDNDGRLDILVVNGATVFIPEQHLAGDPWPLHQPNQLFRNLGGGRFEDVSSIAGTALAVSQASRGAAFGDLDNDGDTDVVISNNAGTVQVLENLVGSRSPWLGMRLIDTHGSDALGAKVTLSTEAGQRLRVLQTAGSYASAKDPRILFGLGSAKASEVTIVWPNGERQRLAAPGVGRYHLIQQPPQP